MNRPQNVFEPHPKSKISPFGPKSQKIAPTLGQNKKVKIEGSIENISCLFI